MILPIETGKGEIFVCRECDKKFATDEYAGLFPKNTDHVFNPIAMHCPVCGNTITRFIKNEDYKDA